MAVIQGKRIIYLYRLLSKSTAGDATGIMFTTENSTSISNDTDTTQTKSGAVTTSQGAEISISATAIASTDSKDVLEDLKTACKNGEIVEIWEVNLDEKGTGESASKYKATYYQGICNSYELSSSSDDHAEASVEFGINGTGADGYATVTDEQIDAATYVYKDVTKEVGA